jgi:hypothetical protein
MTNHEKVAQYFPEPYRGEIDTFGDEKVSIIDAANDIDVYPIFQRVGVWAITSYGLECLSHSYPIEKERLEELDWADHMTEKTWINIKDFKLALLTAKTMLELGII